MKLINTFNARNFDPAQSSGQLPIGRHKVIIEDSEIRETAKKDGGYLQLNLKIVDGPNAGDTGPYRLNIYSQNEMAVSIANRQLSAVCYVTGVFDIEDSAQLHNIPFFIEVGPQKREPQYSEVKKVFDINGNEPGKTVAPASTPVPEISAPEQTSEHTPWDNPPAAVKAPWMK